MLQTEIQAERVILLFDVFTLFSYRSWQTLKFDKQPASFIRIVGTHNTANEVKTLFIMVIRFPL